MNNHRMPEASERLDIAAAVRAMPFGMHKIGVVFLFQWYAIVVHWQFVATSIGESVFNVTPGVAADADLFVVSAYNPQPESRRKTRKKANAE
jgi:hypothetical protein